MAGPVGKSTRCRSIAIVVTLGTLATGACGDGRLRGEVSRSRDGRTYLVVDDDNGGGCGGLIVDGAVWPHPVGAAGRIEPGFHSIYCGPLAEFHVENAIEFRVPAGVVFRFDYWGP